MNNKYTIDKNRVAQSFSYAAQQYDNSTILRQQTADELLDRLSFITVQPKAILDLGSGTGRNISLLAKKYPKAKIIALDIAQAMLKKAKYKFQHGLNVKHWLPNYQNPVYIGGDADAMPLANNSIDIVYANLSLQWCDFEKCFAEIQRILRPNGLLTCALLGPDTLNELRQAWAKVDDYAHVNIYYDAHDLGEAMINTPLVEPVLDIDRITFSHKTAIALMKNLKEIGAHNINKSRRHGLTGKMTLRKVANAYEPFRHNGLLPASYEIIYAHAWRTKQPYGDTYDNNGTIKIPINQIYKRTAR